MRVGLIGFGYWGKILSRCFSEVPGADVFFIADISAVRREEARRLFPRAVLASRWAELLGADNVDAVAIATPANTHFGIAKAALDAGKHSWVEKPLAETISQVKALHMFAQQRERVLFIDHTFLYDASVRLIKEILAQKKAKKFGIINPSALIVVSPEQIHPSFTTLRFTILPFWISLLTRALLLSLREKTRREASLRRVSNA
jgi:predicted dehydrogenase